MIRLWPQPPVRFHWGFYANVWFLKPSPVTVRRAGAHYWTIYINDRPVYARYTSMEAAKRDAWQYLYQHRRAICGAYRITLDETASAEIEELRAEVARLRDELDEAEEVIKRKMLEET